MWRLIDFVRHEGEVSLNEIMMSADMLSRALHINSVIAESIISEHLRAISFEERLLEEQIKLLYYGDGIYPEILREILGRSAPPILFAKGNCNLLQEAGVGFCGSRHASLKGLDIADKCASELTRLHFNVISGYANGVDMAAHLSAMRQNGSTVFVLAEGIFRAHHKSEVDGMLTDSNHVFVSQFAPDTAWFAHNAMRRNDLIVALSEAMIVVEAGEGSGSFAAGESAIRYRKPLFVVDYKNPPQTAKGNVSLLKRGGIGLRADGKGRPKIADMVAKMRALNEEQYELL